MNILEYQDLDLQGVAKSYIKVVEMIRNHDFYSAKVKKLLPTTYYRAELDHSNRLLFKIVCYEGETYALMLEVIRQHDYSQSRFLNGAIVDESKIVDSETEPAEPIAYLNKNNARFHWLDKVISFDDAQQEIYQTRPPVLIIGSAGSGKTALTLEKMKQTTGDILYVTYSPYLVQNSRNLYYAHQYQNDLQTVDFLSYQELIETIQVPAGKEMTFKAFKEWVKPWQRHKLLQNTHALYEEFKGVFSGPMIDKPYLSREDYLNLGVKQSIFLPEQREQVYELYEKYLAMLKQHVWYDMNLLSYAYLSRCTPRYDFVVIDEIQDFTNIQLVLILKTLKNPGQFLLCGDANQIVHPNFFSWSKIKTLFYEGELTDSQQITRILSVNYRNSMAVTHLANRILKLKNARLGSVDKESHYLIESRSRHDGAVIFLKAASDFVRELNQKTRKSIRVAVIVLRDEWKAHAARLFDTPLVFSIYEVKGLEYDQIILLDFISAEPQAFLEITRGVTPTDLDKPLTYARLKDKTDRSLEIYKFYINALYVALTRSVQTIYWVESGVQHPLFSLLELREQRDSLTITGGDSTLEEWQREARKLELQGKQEQADAIRDRLIQKKPVPWEVITPEKAEILKQTMFTAAADKKQKIAYFEYALVYQDHPALRLFQQQKFPPAQNLEKSVDLIQRKYFDNYAFKNPAGVLKEVELYGIDFRNPFNQTPLMTAAYVGNAALVKTLLSAGANSDLTDNRHRDAFQILLHHACRDSKFCQNKLAESYALLAPVSLSLQAGGCLVKIDQKNMEFLLFYVTVWLLINRQGGASHFRAEGLTTADYLRVLETFPESVLADYRKKRAYLSSLLSKNEISRQDRYNRKLFKRVRQGHYILNPDLSIKLTEDWLPVASLLDFSLKTQPARQPERAELLLSSIE
jgi:hypothetical protein